jgi:hypothetical protein
MPLPTLPLRSTSFVPSPHTRYCVIPKPDLNYPLLTIDRAAKALSTSPSVQTPIWKKIYFHNMIFM